MNRLTFSPAAREDLKEIFDYISTNNPSAGKNLVRKLKETCHRLARFPHIGVLRDDLAHGVRCFPIGSYLIFYRLDEYKVEVIRVIHGSRDYLGQVD